MNVELAEAIGRRVEREGSVNSDAQDFLVGSTEEVADDLIAWVEETDIDGFNLSRIVTPELPSLWREADLAADVVFSLITL